MKGDKHMHLHHVVYLQVHLPNAQGVRWSGLTLA